MTRTNDGLLQGNNGIAGGIDRPVDVQALHRTL